MGSHGKILGLVPYDFRSPNLERARLTFWNPSEERFLVPTFFGIGWTANVRSAHRHPLQAALVAALVLWRIRAGKGR